MEIIRRGGARLLAGTVLAAAVAVVAAGCAGGAESMSGESAASEGGAVGSVAEPRTGDWGPAGDTEAARQDGRPAEPAQGRKDGAANRTTVQTRAVIRKGDIALVTKELNRARTEIADLLARHGGYLASEDTTNDRSGRPERSVLVLRVPEPAFVTVMEELAGIGRPERTDHSSEDVTTEVIDVDARVATAEASLARLQRFLRRARNVTDMIRLESEIASRQAELESLQAQQKYLGDQTSMATVRVHLRTPAAPPPSPVDDDAGFLAGLADGWRALQTVLVGAATVAGALLPFALTTALVAVPAWLLLRAARRRRTGPSPTAEAG